MNASLGSIQIEGNASGTFSRSFYKFLREHSRVASLILKCNEMREHETKCDSDACRIFMLIGFAGNAVPHGLNCGVTSEFKFQVKKRV